jgi:hypothetical protein
VYHGAINSKSVRATLELRGVKATPNKRFVYLRVVLYGNVVTWHREAIRAAFAPKSIISDVIHLFGYHYYKLYLTIDDLTIDPGKFLQEHTTILESVLS